MPSLLPFGSPPTITATFSARGKAKLLVYNVREYGALGDNSTDDTTAIQAAITAALAAPNGIGTVYFPPGTYLISSALVCTNATGSGGVGVTLRGAGHGASTIKKTASGQVGVTWNGSGGPGVNSTAYGGLIDITVEGGATTGGLVQANSAQQMFFRGFSLNGGVDFALDLNTCQDSYFDQWTSNSVHSASAPIVHIYGSASGNTNQLFFSHFRIEDFYGNAIKIEQGSGNSGTNNGFYFADMKLETGNVSGDMFVTDVHTLDLHIERAFGSANSYKPAYSTPISMIKTSAYQSTSFKQIYFNDGIGGQVAAVNVQPTGTDFGVGLCENVWYNGDGNTATINFGSTVSNMVWTILGCGTDGTKPILAGTKPYQLIDLNSTVAGGGTMNGTLSLSANLDFSAGAGVTRLNPTPAAGGVAGTILSLTSAQTQAIGDIVKIDGSGHAALAKADAIANASAILIAAKAVTGSGANDYLMPGGILRLSASPSWTVGGLIYLTITGTTGNTMTQTAPSATNNVIQILGVALAADTILFSPSLTQVEHT